MDSELEKRTNTDTKPSLATAVRGQRIARALVESGSLTAERLNEVLSAHEGAGLDLPATLLEQGLITVEDIAEALVVDLNVRLVDLKRHKVSQEALRLIPEETARRYRLVPMDITGDALVVVMEDPGDIEAIDAVAAQAARARLRVQVCAGFPSEVQAAIDLNYRSRGEADEQVRDFAELFEAFEETSEDADESAIGEAPAVRTLNMIMSQGVRERASDIHIEPQVERVRVRFRVDGALRDALSLPRSALDPLISRIKIQAGMNITERRRPQGGQFSTRIGETQLDVRVATMDTACGETAVLRLLDKSLSLLSLQQLGFQDSVLGQYQQLLRAPYGMIAFSGPTGAGKTTSLYASINQLDRQANNIMTIEDPIEYVFSDIKQTKVNEKAGITFATALRSFMRLDSDIILVGEIRDEDTAQTAIQASLTGHLVFSSIHANDASSVPYRLTNLGVEPYLISSVLIGVIAQRMARRICPHCRVSATAGEQTEAAAALELGLEPAEAFRGTGCNLCNNTGYLGRVGLFELLPFNEEISPLFLSGAGAAEIRRQAISGGMMTLRQDGTLKVRQGMTTPSEVLRNVSSIQSSSQATPTPLQEDTSADEAATREAEAQAAATLAQIGPETDGLAGGAA